MNARVAAAAPVIEWSSAGVALAASGEGDESGDLCVVVPRPHQVLVAAIDGLGHGAEAALAARAAGEVLETHPDEPVIALVRRCHDAIRRTRGVVMSLASFDARSGTMTWIGVGNVEGLLLRGNGDSRTREAIATRGGVVGYQLPPLRSSTIAVSPGDLLIFTTDGIRSDFSTNLSPARSPRVIAQSIVADYAKRTDDCLAVVARYCGVLS